MNITELEEFQGLTAEIVREWLRGKGWVLGPAPERDGYTPPGRFWTKRAASIWDAAVLVRLMDVAEAEDISVQALLRQINPRLRKGPPSPEARAAHDGLWIVAADDEQPAIHIERLTAIAEWCHIPRLGYCNFAIHGHWALFWPCDAAGNKVPWPTRDGRLL